MIEIAVMVLAPFAGWLAKNQLEYNKQTRENTAAIKSLVENSNHTVERVDAIFDHLITRERP